MGEDFSNGLLIGNFVVRPRDGTVRGAENVHPLSAEGMRVLLALARQPGRELSFAELADAGGENGPLDADRLRIDLEDIRAALGDRGPNPRFLLETSDGITLIAPVQVAAKRDGEVLEKISLFEDFRRRKVIRVAAAYVVLAWVAIQVADTILPALGLPGWSITLTIALAMLGFPVAVVVAWLFEATPTGAKLDRRAVPARLTRSQKWIDIGVLSCLAIVVGFLSLNVLRDVRREWTESTLQIAPRMVTAASNTVAVLPFQFMGRVQDNDYIGDGIAAEILRLLSRLQELRVAAHTASFYFKGKDVDPQTIAQKLQVRHLLTGSVQVSDDSIRVNAELLDAVTGYLIWSEVFDRKMVDILEIQSEIAKAVADTSSVVLSADSSAALRNRPTNNLEAYDFYLRGRDYLRQPRTSDVLQNAQRMFHRALALDPGYALARAGLCETHLAIYIRTKSVATVDDAESDCKAALEIDETLPEVHTALGFLYWHTGDFDAAESRFRIAINTNPNFYEAYSGLSDALFSLNRLDEAGLVLQQLLELQPGYWRSWHKMGAYYYRQGEDAKALPYFAQVTELTPDNAPGWNNLGAVRYMLGDLAGAATAWQRGIEIEPTQSMYANLGTMYYYLGRFQDSVEMQREAIELAPDDFRLWGRMAAAYGRMSDREAEANSAYRKAISLAEQVVGVNPNEADALKNLALFYAHTGQAERASSAIERALELTPTDPDTHFFASLTFLELGQDQRCIQELETAVKFGYPLKLIASEHALDRVRELERYRLLFAGQDDGA